MSRLAGSLAMVFSMTRSRERPSLITASRLFTPFEDGNGRVGRLLLNLMLMSEGYPPAQLLHDWRVRYIRALSEANTGNYNPLLNLIGQSVEAGLDLYLEACDTTPAYQLLRELVTSSGYPLDYLSWLARQGRIDAIKRNGR